MERLTVQATEARRPEGALLARDSRQEDPAAPVDRIAEDRKTDVGHVDPDLVRPARFQAHVEEAQGIEASQKAEAGPGGASATAHDSHLLAVAQIPADRGVDGAGGGRGTAPAEGDVSALEFAAGDLTLEIEIGPSAAGDDHEAAREAVEAVDDAGAFGGARPLPLGAQMQQTVRERSRLSGPRPGER